MPSPVHGTRWPDTLGIWQSSQTPVIDSAYEPGADDPTHDVAFVSIDPDRQGRSLETVLNGGYPVEFNAFAGPNLTLTGTGVRPPASASPPPPSRSVYAYDVAYALGDGSPVQGPPVPRPNGLHSCVGPSYTYSSTYAVNPLLLPRGGCNIGVFGSGGAWLSGAATYIAIEGRQIPPNSLVFQSWFKAGNCCGQIGTYLGASALTTYLATAQTSGALPWLQLLAAVVLGYFLLKIFVFNGSRRYR